MTLAARVMWVCLMVTVAGALLTTITAGLIAQQLVSVADDERLRGSALGLGAELNGAKDVDVAALAAHEGEEIAPAGMRLAVFRDGLRVAGEPASLPDPGCHDTWDASGAPIRLCAHTQGRFVVAYWSSTATRTSAHRAYAFGALAAVLISALMVLAFSRSLAAWAVRPLNVLRASIDGMSRESPRGVEVATLERVPEVESIANALNGLVRKLAASLSESRRFAAGAAHELRTPLATVSAELELLSETSLEAPTLRRLQSTVAGLSARVDSLLVLATSHDSHLLREAVTLSEIVEACVAALPADKRARVVFACEEPVAALTVRGDSTLLHMAIANALDNALKFSSAPVEARIIASGDNLLCEIKDHGPGVAAADRERAFEPFYRAAAVSSNGVRGYGLGLALIAHVARVHGGTVGFAEVAAGALLRITLPMWQPTP